MVHASVLCQSLILTRGAVWLMSGEIRGKEARVGLCAMYPTSPSRGSSVTAECGVFDMYNVKAPVVRKTEWSELREIRIPEFGYGN